ncbi:ATP-dependent RNA helicase DDX18/HAS1 [Angomonas deanei]|uniref:ATP-dependent RNA helicase n=1 Tax=Angomonas deanei TaxID=59799 RepID=A0A7G2C595_9TRYP|nr:ATP-dependent RNA helicase DDX18/HAS1 [Angomonas deanei]CAD2214311.1 DEAD/DEAH box helicase/Helicase conserved C-terminal domain/Domain of unknown function (DUF4217), putative [Angomonas deanei]|eukprot:EPY32586.1 ATP-dependent RNA helicase DDX18/HAS1 [Angomonas deanei]
MNGSHEDSGAESKEKRKRIRHHRSKKQKEQPTEEVADEPHYEEEAEVAPEVEHHEKPMKRKRQRTEEEEDHTHQEPEKEEVIDMRPLRTSAPAVTNYKELKLNPHVESALEQEFKFTTLTDIQARCIPTALQGKDLLAEAKTGAGKTLAFLIPIVEMITRAGFRPSNGTAAVIIGPTRELCLQIEGVLLRLLKFFNGSITFLCCIGGQSRSQEGYKLANGVMIVVASPGRLLDHLKLTTDWHTKNLLVLAVDEADRVLDNGFEEDMREIVSLLPKTRQTLLFSATQTTRVEQLARVSFNKQPYFISMKGKKDKATVDTLEQGYVMCPSEKRLLVLYHFVKKNAKKKIIVFFSSRNSVSFHCELFNYIDAPCVAFHGKQKQHQRSATYMQFCNAPSGVLFTTDVAARGLDIPAVDWIVQFDPPDDPVKYIHRVGRTARAGRAGNALMFLLPLENMFLKYLFEDAKVAVNEYTFDLSKLNPGIQEQLEKLVSSNYYLRSSAKQAYEGYLLSYSSSQLKNVFNIQKLDLAAVARGFALSEPPPIRLDLSESAANMSKKSRKEFKQTQNSKDVRRRKLTEKKHSNLSGEW